MTTFKLSTVGRIRTGKDADRFIIVRDDRDASGGYLILTADDPEMSIRVFDDWVADSAGLEAYFADGEEEIDWTSPA